MLTISKLKRWSINYYIDTAASAEHASRDLAPGLSWVIMRPAGPWP
jgi:hypothetical protein